MVWARFAFDHDSRDLGLLPLAPGRRGKGWWALPYALLSSIRTTLPFLVLRYINPFTYVASATRVVPAFLSRRKRQSVETGVVWERASVRRRTRTGAVFIWNVALLAVSTVAVANFAPMLNPINQEAWRLTYERGYVDLNDHDYLPFMVVEASDTSNPTLTTPTPATPTPTTSILGTPQVAGGNLPTGGNPSTPSLNVSLDQSLDGAQVKSYRLSAYCDPTFTTFASVLPRTFEGNPGDYTYKGRWHLRMLARFAPLIPYMESAATAYDVSPELLLRIFLNESDLDPLAVGPTQDIGLAQVTSDALTLLKALATDANSPFYNPQFFAGSFSVFDPDFSVCAGAAKLSWATRQQGVDDDQEAYALYINPVIGLKRGSMTEEYQLLTEQIIKLEDMSKTLSDTIAAYRYAPEKLTKPERNLLEISDALAQGKITLEGSYEAVYDIVQHNEIKDTDMYQKFLTTYFGETGQPSSGLETTSSATGLR
ncbi:MAG: transglycosylase SLT domain-containing protein [Trueperaceae bacterium]